MPDRPRGRRKTFVGVVVSDRMEKTRVVSIEWMAPDRRVKKFVRRRLKVKAHDERNDAHIGDRVRIRETRPLSKEKRWRIVSVIERSRRPAEALRRRPRDAESAPEVLV